MNVRYEELLPHEIVAARRRCAVAYLPIGGIEWHGKHLAVGNDTLKAHALCVRIAENHGGLRRLGERSSQIRISGAWPARGTGDRRKGGREGTQTAHLLTDGVPS